jgi:hypothetical protein
MKAAVAAIEPHHIVLALRMIAPELFNSADIEPVGGLPIDESAAELQALVLSHAAKRSLAYAAHECERAIQRLISPAHILIGICREQPHAAVGKCGELLS